MTRRVLLKSAYRVLRPPVAYGLTATFVVCVGGGMLLQTFTGSPRVLFILFALAFVVQSAIFLGVRFVPAIRQAAANPSLAEQRSQLVFGIGFLSACCAAFLAFLAFA